MASNQPSLYSRSPRKDLFFKKRLAETSSLFSIFRKQSPLFSLHRSMKRPEAVCPGFLKVPTSGFGYPLAGSKLSLPREPVSAPNAHELFPSELFSTRVIERRLPFPFSALAFSHKTLPGLAPTLQRLDPTRTAVPLIRNPTFYVESGTRALLGFSTSQALPPQTLPVKHLPSRLSPPALPYPFDLAISWDR